MARDLDLNVQVAHYPPGCSKYNPIEHRLFCHITRAWRAVVLRTIDVAKHYLARVSTAQGLRVVAEIARRTYEKGLPVESSSILGRKRYRPLSTGRRSGDGSSSGTSA